MAVKWMKMNRILGALLVLSGMCLCGQALGISPVSELVREAKEQVRSLDADFGGSGCSPSQKQILRDGLWPSPQALNIVRVLRKAYRHGVAVSEESLEILERAAKEVVLARDSVALARTHGVSEPDIMLGRVVGASLAFRELESLLVAEARILVKETLVRGGRPSRKLLARKLDRLFRNPVSQNLFPSHPQYTALVTGLKAYRALDAKGDWSSKALDERLVWMGWMSEGDSAVLRRQSIRAFQKAYHLQITGIVDSATQQALDVTPQERIYELTQALQRWHRSPSRGEKSYFRVNIPAYELEVWMDGVQTHVLRTVVGDMDGMTWEFDRKINAIQVNPAWYVPDAIKRRDLDKRARLDRTFYKSNGFRLYKGATGRQKVVQEPGEGNWLGRVVFRWDKRAGTNGHLIHDSPFQERFGLKDRALSHGCVNLEDARELAVAVAEKFGGYSKREYVRRFQSGKNQTLSLRKAIPSFFEYVTVVADSQGRLAFLPDIYDRVPQWRGDMARQGKPAQGTF